MLLLLYSLQMLDSKLFSITFSSYNFNVVNAKNRTNE